MNAEGLSQIHEPKSVEYKTDDLVTKDLVDRKDSGAELSKIEMELVKSITKDELDLNGLMVDINSIIRKNEKVFTPEVLLGIKTYHTAILELKDEITKTGVLPPKEGFQHFTNKNHLRPAIKAAAARELLHVGFDSLKTINDIETIFFRASDYIPGGILDKERRNMDETTIKNAFNALATLLSYFLPLTCGVVSKFCKCFGNLLFAIE
jgi:hypothetical protein